MRQLTEKFSSISKEQTFRFDVDFLEHQNTKHLTTYYNFNGLFSFAQNVKVDSKNIEGNFLYCEIGDVSKNGDIAPIELNYENRNELNENYFQKIDKGDIAKCSNDEILISKVRPYLKKIIFITEDNKDIFYTSAFLRIVPKKIPKLLYYCFRTVFFESLLSISRQGKGYPTLSEKDFLSLKFNKVAVDYLIKNEASILSKIEPIEQEIKVLKAQVIPSQEIINQVFAKTFGFDYEAFKKLKKIKNYNLGFSMFASNIDIRQSVKFHREAAEFVLVELKKHTTKKIKHFISEPIVLGKGISPAEYDDNGDFVYLAMSNIKNWQFEMDEARGVTNTFSKNNPNKRVAIDDIIMARSGEGTIGKVALIEDEDLQGIFADFTMRIRLNNYDPRFAYYYFRTSYFQYLIEINKKGLGNNTNIFPSQIQEFPLIDITLEQQQVVVNEIRNEIDRQNVFRQVIDDKRHEIDQIIEQSIPT